MRIRRARAPETLQWLYDTQPANVKTLSEYVRRLLDEIVNAKSYKGMPMALMEHRKRKQEV